MKIYLWNVDTFHLRGILTNNDYWFTAGYKTGAEISAHWYIIVILTKLTIVPRISEKYWNWEQLKHLRTIGSDNGLEPVWRQTVTATNAYCQFNRWPQNSETFEWSANVYIKNGKFVFEPTTISSWPKCVLFWSLTGNYLGYHCIIEVIRLKYWLLVGLIFCSRQFELKNVVLHNSSCLILDGQIDKVTFTKSHIPHLESDIFGRIYGLQVLLLHSIGLMLLPAQLFRGMTSLRTLSLKENHLNSLPKDIFKGLINLMVIYFSSNQLRYSNRDIFSDLASLQYLGLNKNDLVHVSDYAFGIAPYDFINLQTVSFDNNQLEDFPIWLLDMPFLSEIDLSRNHLNFSGIAESIRRSKNPMYDQNIFTYKHVSTRKMILTNNFVRNMELSDFDKATWIKVGRFLMTFQLNIYGNGLECNCHIYSLYKLFQRNQEHNQLDITQGIFNAICQIPVKVIYWLMSAKRCWAAISIYLLVRPHVNVGYAPWIVR